MVKQVVSKKRVRDFGEVYTNEREVKAMCDLIPLDVWENIDSTFLEPACGNGNFLVEIIQRKLKYCRSGEDVLRAFRSVFGIDIQPDNVEQSRSRMLSIAPEWAEKEKVMKILEQNIICGDSLKIMSEYLEDEKQ